MESAIHSSNFNTFLQLSCKVSKCVDSIYSAIASGDCSLAEVVLDREVAEFFGLDENSNGPMFHHSGSKLDEIFLANSI